MIIVEASKPPLVLQPEDPGTSHASSHIARPAAGPMDSGYHPPFPSLSYPHTPGTSTTPLLRPPPPAGPPPPSYPKSAAQPICPRTQRPPSATKRFWKAFAFALLIYLALLSLARTTIVHVMHRDRPGRGADRWDHDDDGRVLESIGPLDWTVHQTRPHWAPPTFSDGAETLFLLPIASEELYLISRGAYQSGKVQVTQATTAMEWDEEHVRVDVRVAYRDERALARARVCRLRKGGNRHGVGIYTPAGWPSVDDQLYFEVALTFPRARRDDPLRVRSLTTHTSNFAYEIGDLWRSVSFDDVEVNTSNAPVRANSITLTKGSFISSNGPIVGHFNASDVLVLHTSNAGIQATVSLFSMADTNATRLEMRTSNGPITSPVSLITASGTGGDFGVTAQTSNGALEVAYEDVPLEGRLASDVRTSNAPVGVVMHAAYEGTYEVATSNGRPVVREGRVVDPSGAGRRRVVSRWGGKGRAEGTVVWEGGGVRGSCVVRTSNAGATLDL